MASAQFQQYTPPGSLAEEPEDAKSRLENAVADARWRLGPFRVEPWIGVRDVTYVEDTFSGTGTEPTSDITATAGAGLRAYLRTGPDVIFAAHMLPEYVWWKDQDGRSQATGRYGLGAFAFFNRMTLEISGRRDEGQRIVTPEFEQFVSTSEDKVRFAIDVRASSRFSTFGSLDLYSVENLMNEPPNTSIPTLNHLDRDETIIRAGLRFHANDSFSIGLGAESSDVEFDNQEIALSNSGVAPLLQILFDRENYAVDFELAFRDLKPEGVSDFVPYNSPTGNLRVHLNKQNRLNYSIYAYRTLAYSIQSDFAYFENTRIGLGGSYEMGWRTTIGAYVETGTHDYIQRSESVTGRDEDVVAFGMNIGFRINRKLGLSLGVTHTEHDSKSSEFDRSQTTIRTGLSLGGGSSPWW